jgi:hypothetical protein
MPTNTSAATATVIGARPYSITVDPGLLSGFIANSLWWYRDAVEGDDFLPVYASNADFDDVTNFYETTIKVWTGTPGSLTQVVPTGVNRRQALIVPVTAGTRYYIEVADFWTDDGGSYEAGNEMTFSVVAKPNLAAPIGSLIVPNDVAPFALAVLSAADGDTLRLVAFPPCERGAVLPSGIMCVNDSDNLDTVHVYDDQLALIGSVTITPGADAFKPVITEDGTYFYLIDRYGVGTTALSVTRITNPGTVPELDATTWSVPVVVSTSQAVKSAGVSRDGSILYWTFVNTQGVHRYDLVNSVGLTDLVAIPAGPPSYALDLIVLSDDTILVGYIGAGADFIRRYATDGSTLNTYTLSLQDTLNHIQPDATDPDAFWVWSFPGDLSATFSSPSRFQQIRASDGVVLTTFVVEQFNDGIGPAADKYDPGDMPRHQHANSCPFFVSRVALDDEDEPVEPPPYTRDEAIAAGTLENAAIRWLRRTAHVRRRP